MLGREKGISFIFISACGEGGASPVAGGEGAALVHVVLAPPMLLPLLSRLLPVY